MSAGYSRSKIGQRAGFGGEQRPGGHRVIDDRTGFMVFASDCSMEWDNLFCVDPDIRNPQDFVRGVPDPQIVSPVRPEQPDVFLSAPVTPDDL